MLVPDRYLKILLVLILMGCIPSEVFAIDLNGSWTYRENGGSNVETFRETRQNYSFGVGPSLSYKPSHALSANASVGYTQVNTVDESSSSTSRVVTPTAGFVLINDLFTARISGSSVNSQSGGGDWTADSNWNSTLSSGWSEPYIPSLQLSYGESGDSTQSSAISSLETQRRDFGAGIDWDLNLAEFTYRYRDSSSEALSNTQSQFFKVVTAGRFLDNRLSFSLSQQAQFETFEISSGLVGGTVDVPVGQTTRYAVSSTDTPVDYNCNVTSTAGVDCLTSASFPITYTASSYVQIAVSPLDNRSIGVVEIAFNTEFNTADSSVWDLYEYRSASDSW